MPQTTTTIGYFVRNFSLDVPASVQRAITTIEIISIILSIFFVFIFIFALIKIWPYRPRIYVFFKPKQQKVIIPGIERTIQIPDSAIKKRWMNVLRSIDPKSHESMALSVIAADKIVDDALKQLGFAGMTMAERLKALHPERIKSLQDLWDAHKMRNQLVHDPDFKLDSNNAKKALLSFEAFLKEMQLI